MHEQPRQDEKNAQGLKASCKGWDDAGHTQLTRSGRIARSRSRMERAGGGIPPLRLPMLLGSAFKPRLRAPTEDVAAVSAVGAVEGFVAMPPVADSKRRQTALERMGAECLDGAQCSDIQPLVV